MSNWAKFPCVVTSTHLLPQYVLVTPRGKFNIPLLYARSHSHKSPQPPPKATSSQSSCTPSSALVCYVLPTLSLSLPISSVTVFGPQDKATLTGWRECTSPKLWRLSLWTQHPPGTPNGANTASLKAFSAYNIPSIEALIRYLHSRPGLPVCSTWLAAIKSGNYSSWTGINHQNSSKY